MRCWLVPTEGESIYDRVRRIEKVGLKGLQEGGWSPSIPAPDAAEATVGDLCLVWRTGRGGGIVATGEIGEPVALPPVESHDFSGRGLSDGVPNPPQLKSSIDLARTMLATPLSRGVWRQRDSAR